MLKRIIRISEVRERTGLSKSTIYAKVSNSEFPSSVSLGDRAVGWIESEVDQWIADRITARKNNGYLKGRDL